MNCSAQVHNWYSNSSIFHSIWLLNGWMEDITLSLILLLCSSPYYSYSSKPLLSVAEHIMQTKPVMFGATTGTTPFPLPNSVLPSHSVYKIPSAQVLHHYTFSPSLSASHSFLLSFDISASFSAHVLMILKNHTWKKAISSFPWSASSDEAFPSPSARLAS